MFNEDSVHRTLGYLEHLLEERAQRDSTATGEQEPTGASSSSGTPSETVGETPVPGQDADPSGADPRDVSSRPPESDPEADTAGQGSRPKTTTRHPDDGSSRQPKDEPGPRQSDVETVSPGPDPGSRDRVAGPAPGQDSPRPTDERPLTGRTEREAPIDPDEAAPATGDDLPEPDPAAFVRADDAPSDAGPSRDVGSSEGIASSEDAAPSDAAPSKEDAAPSEDAALPEDATLCEDPAPSEESRDAATGEADVRARSTVDENETTLELPPLDAGEVAEATSPGETEPPAETRLPGHDNGVQPYRRLTTRLGTLLVDKGLISTAELDRALEEHRDHGERLGHYLVEQGLVQEADLVRVLAEQYGVPAAPLDDMEVEEEVLDLVPVEMARRYLVVPVSATGGALDLAMVDPTDVVAIANLKFATGLRPQPLIATERAVLAAIQRFYHGPEAKDEAKDEAGPSEEGLVPRDVRRALRSLILERDQAVMDLGSDPRAAYRLAVHVDDLVDEIIGLVLERASRREN